MSSILIIEDDPAIREALEFKLRAEGFAVEVATTGSQGLELASGRRFDLILLDLLLPGIDGFEVCRRLRDQDRKTRIIMLTALGSEDDKVRGLTLGADDYLTKPFGYKELLARVRAQLRRCDSQDSLAFGDIEIDPKRHRLTVKGRAVALRPKEFQLLHALAATPGIVLSRNNLGAEVWQSDWLGLSRTIDVHIQRLRQKVERLSDYQLIHTVHGLGYRFEPRRKQGRRES